MGFFLLLILYFSGFERCAEHLVARDCSATVVLDVDMPRGGFFGGLTANSVRVYDVWF